MFGMNNDVIGNHVVGHEHGLWTPGSSQPNGRPFGYSLGKVSKPGGWLDTSDFVHPMTHSQGLLFRDGVPYWHGS